MIVGRSTFREVLATLMGEKRLALDSETFGLRPYHGDRLFSLIIATESEGYYFNFKPYEGMNPDHLLPALYLERLKELFNRLDVQWFLTNAKYDMHILWQETIELRGEIHDTLALGRIERNDHLSYSLDACLKRIGECKDDAVDKYIKENKLVTKVQPEWKADAVTLKHFDRVPLDIIVPYGIQDARGTFALGTHQEKSIHAQSEAIPEGLPRLSQVAANEKRLTKTIYRMERHGVRVDLGYSLRAAKYEEARGQAASDSYQREAGRAYKASPKDFAEIFASEKDKWSYTEKGNPSFDSDALEKFENPAAKLILTIREAKSNADFYRGFLYHADKNGDVHASFNQHGAQTGRFSSSEPNFQNLKSDEGDDLKQEFVVRRAITPRPGFTLYGRDYKQMEYVMMADYAASLWGRETEMVRLIRAGHDPHQATADIVTRGGTELKRGRAKNVNFAELYGAGIDTLAATAGCSREEAMALRALVRKSLPEISNLTRAVSSTAKTRGYVRNWFGRICQCADPNFSYAIPNHLIQGGCADVNKLALNGIDEALLGMKSRLIMTIHDEAVLEVHESEMETVPALVKEIMDTVYIGKYLTLTTSGYHGPNLADILDCA